MTSAQTHPPRGAPEETKAAPTGAAEVSARPPRPKKGEDGERKCLATGDLLPKDRLIRFVIGPNHAVVPDLAENLPGRGLWVTADADAITLAATKNLFAKAAQASARPARDLAELVATLLQARCLAFIGMARSAGIAVLGQPQVEAALKANEIKLLLLATDAGARMATAKADQLCRRFTRAELGGVLGRDQIVYAGLKRHALTDKLIKEIARLEKTLPMPHTTPIAEDRPTQ